MRISQDTLSVIRALRDCIRRDEGGGGQCANVVQELVQTPEFENAQTTAGYFVTADGNVVDDHWWIVLDDESILDPTQDQFGDESFGDIVHLSKKDPRHEHYFPYGPEPGIPPEVLQLADRIRARKRTEKNRTFGEMVEDSQGLTLYHGTTVGDWKRPGSEALHGNLYFSSDPSIARQHAISGSESWYESWVIENNIDEEDYDKVAWPREGKPILVRFDLEILRKLPGVVLEPDWEMPDVDEDTTWQESLRDHKTLSVDGFKDSFKKYATIDLVEDWGGRPVGDPNRQSKDDMPDYISSGGIPGVPEEGSVDEFKPEEFEDEIRKHVMDDYGEFGDFEYEPEIFTLEAGTTVYHGTSTGDWNEGTEDPEPPFWVSDNEYDVQFFVTWHAQHNQGRRRIIEFRTTRPLQLLRFDSRDEMDEFSDYTGIDMDFPEEAAEGICARGWDGWIVPGNYQYGGSDIMICQPGVLEYVNTEVQGEDLVLADLTIPEVDHPEFMPGGDETHGYDPAYDPPYDDRRPTYNMGHPKP